MRITPLSALEPYKADAAPPFNTDILSMSSGFRSPSPFPISAEGFQKSLLLAPTKFSIGTPSTTIRGWLSPVKDVNPLNTIFEEEAGPLEPLTTCKPATLPVKALAMLFSLASVNASPLMSWKENPRDFFSLFIPIAVTTTSSILLASCSNSTLRVGPLTSTSLGAYPTMERSEERRVGKEGKSRGGSTW